MATKRQRHRRMRHRGALPRRFLALRVEPLENRSMLSCPAEPSCPMEPIPQENHVPPGPALAGPLEIGNDTATFLATSSSVPGASGYLAIEFTEKTLRWESVDRVLGSIAIASGDVVRWSYSPQQGNQPAALVLVGHDDGMLIGARVLFEPYNRGVVHVAKDGRLVRYELTSVDLDVDTNRDGAVQDLDDEDGEDAWEPNRGAYFNVNLDRDGQRQTEGMPLPDAIHFDSHGTPVYEDFRIENADDELDVAPLVIRKVADEIPIGYSVILRSADPEDLRRIHVYKSISSDAANTAIWGNATGEPPPSHVDITSWVNPASPVFQGDPVTGDTTFGIEGLFFRFVGEDVPEKLRFDGYVDFTLELRKGATVISADSVRMKVAPWIMLSRDQPSEEIWSASMGLRGRIQHGPGDRIADGETFTIDDGNAERTFEFDTEAPPGVRQGHVMVDVSRASSASEVGQAIVAAVNGVEGLAVMAYIANNRLPGEPVPEDTGQVELMHTDPSVTSADVMPATESVADPQFRIVGMSGSTNQSLLRTVLADDGYVGLDASGQLHEVLGPEVQNQWFQDHVEIGYTQRPGGPPTHAVFRLPYWRGTSGQNPIWPVTHLLGPDVGIFQLGVFLGGGSGDFGGNLEVLPPHPTHPLGRIVMGNRASPEMQQFLTSQEVQDPVFDLPVQWLQLGHLDEVVSFLANGMVAIADPALAWDLLTEIPDDQQGSRVFFATGAAPVRGIVSANAEVSNRIETGIDHRGQPWKYLRVYEGAARGTIAEIDTLGDGFITVKRVWRTGSKIVFGTGPDRDVNYWRTHTLPSTPGWAGPLPQSGDQFVLVEGTQFSASGTPALVTVAEILADRDFADLNRVDVQGAMNQIRAKLESYVPPGALTFIRVPSLFFGNRSGATGTRFLGGRGAEAFNPGPANLQEAAGTLYIARQFGPRDEYGHDVFEQAIRSAFDLADESAERETAPPPRTMLERVVFVDDWELYHRLIGNVHCGTVVKRRVLGFDWWGGTVR